jgi:hypothetical protein
MKELTSKQESKQKEILFAIDSLLDYQDLISLRDIQNKLGYKSVTSIADYIKKLEKQGLIKRTLGKKGSIKLTEKGLIKIGKPKIISNSVALSKTGIGPNEPKPHQKKIFTLLSDIHPKLGRMYDGALKVLADKSNLDRIAQSAHSMREITYFLTGKLEARFLTKYIDDEANNTNARRMENAFDPRGGVKSLGKTIYDEWNQVYHRNFTQVSHHNYDESKYIALLQNFEIFLLKYVLPNQIETYEQIDKILKTPIQEVNFEDLALMLTKNYETYRYFYKNVGAGWLKTLDEKNFLTPSVEVADYFKRIARFKTVDVSDVILNSDVKIHNDWVKMTYIQIGLDHFEAGKSKELISKISKEKWIEKDEAVFFGDLLIKYLKKLIKLKDYSNASELLSILLKVKKTKGSFESAKLYMNDYELSNLEGVLKSIPINESKYFLNVLKQCLTNIIKIEGGDKSDHSTIWMPDISGKKQKSFPDPKNTIVDMFRDMLTCYIRYSKDNGISKGELSLDRLLPESYSLFSRIRLFLYRNFSNLFEEEIENSIINFINDQDVWYDYLILIHERLHFAKKEIKEKFWANFKELHIKDKKQILTVVKGEIPEDYTNMVTETGIEPLIPFEMGTSWAGPISPKTKEELESMSFNELKEYLINWKPGDKWRSPSCVGLGRDFSELVKEKPAYFSSKVAKLFDYKIRPIYYYYFFIGIRDGIKKSDGDLDWKNLIAFMGCLTDLYINESLPIFEAKDEFEASWDGVFQWMVSFLNAALSSKKHTPNIEFKDEVFRIIKTFCDHKDPVAEKEEYGENRSDPYTNAINSIRGNALLALFHYIIWHNQQKKITPPIIDSEVKKIIKKSAKNESSLAVRSVLGLYFTTIYLYDNEYALSIADDIFPKDNQPALMAAWNMYMCHTVSKEVYKFMKPVCKHIINNLGKKQFNFNGFNNPEERLAQYVVIGYVYEIDYKDDPLLVFYFKKSNEKHRGLAISIIGRAYINGDRNSKNQPNFDIIKEIWDWRLDNYKSENELKDFGWWVNNKKFDAKWMLQHLLKTMRETNGLIDYEYNFFDVLLAECVNFPEMVAKILLLYVNNRNNHNYKIYGHRKEIRKILEKIIDKNNKDLYSNIIKIIDVVSKLGYDDFRDILAKNDGKNIQDPPDSQPNIDY